MVPVRRQHGDTVGHLHARAGVLWRHDAGPGTAPGAPPRCNACLQLTWCRACSQQVEVVYGPLAPPKENIKNAYVLVYERREPGLRFQSPGRPLRTASSFSSEDAARPARSPPSRSRSGTQPRLSQRSHHSCAQPRLTSLRLVCVAGGCHTESARQQARAKLRTALVASEFLTKLRRNMRANRARQQVWCSVARQARCATVV